MRRVSTALVALSAAAALVVIALPASAAARLAFGPRPPSDLAMWASLFPGWLWWSPASVSPRRRRS